MIKITKGPQPAVLATNADKWKKALLDCHAAGQPVPDGIANAYNCAEIKDALRDESRHKCMYCESEISHVAHEHIEHFRPKARTKYPELTFEWTNLGLACPVCNVSKSDDFDENCAHVNPYNEDPADFFVAEGPMVFPRLGNARAELTWESVKLYRAGLIEKRAEKLTNLQLMMRAYTDEPNALMKEIWKRRIKEEVEEDKEYSFCLQAFVTSQLGANFLA